MKGKVAAFTGAASGIGLTSAEAMVAAGQFDIPPANAGLYVGGDLVDTVTNAIDRMFNLNVNVVTKNVHDVQSHMIERGITDIVVTSSLATHHPTPWEPVFAPF